MHKVYITHAKIMLDINIQSWIQTIKFDPPEYHI